MDTNDLTPMASEVLDFAYGEQDALGYLEKNENRKLVVKRVDLHPKVNH